jgi:hypothetical protein
MRSAATTIGLATAAFALLGAASPARADVNGDTFVSTAWRVRLTAPRGWQISERSSYPNVLLWMMRRSPRGRMLLSAEHLPPGQTVMAYAERTAGKLERLGFRVRAPQLHSSTGAYWIDADNGTSFLRQAFLVAGGTGYTLTLASESNRIRSQHLRGFDSALRTLRVLQPDETPAAKDDDGAAPPSSDAGP